MIACRRVIWTFCSRLADTSLLTISSLVICILGMLILVMPAQVVAKSLASEVHHHNRTQAKADPDSPVFHRHLQYLKATEQNSGVLSFLLAEEHYQRLGEYQQASSLLKGELLLDKGLYKAADAIFLELIKTADKNRTLVVQSQFLLAKSYFFQGRLEAALAQLENIDQGKAFERKAELQHYHSLTLMKLGRYKAAVDYIRHYWWQQPEPWGVLTRLNLAFSLIKAGQNDGVDLLKAITLKPVVSRNDAGLNDKPTISHLRPEQTLNALMDKANQSLGFLYLNNQQPVSALKHLQQVSASGPYSDLALLGVGWAGMALEQYDTAVVSWQLLHKKDRRDQAVLESILSLPYAYEQQGNRTQAIAYYKNAVEEFDNELKLLAASKQALQGAALFAELSQLSVVDDRSWYQSIHRAAKGSALRYIKSFMLDAEFSALLKQYREIRRVKHDAEIKIERISELQQTLLKRAGISDIKQSVKNRDQITFIQILSADLLKRSNQLQASSNAMLKNIQSKIQRALLKLLLLREKELEVYLLQSRLALAQNMGPSE